jgi:hypothetical protein
VIRRPIAFGHATDFVGFAVVRIHELAAANPLASNPAIQGVRP